MKRLIAVLSGILVLPAFAEVAPVYYDEIIEYTDDMLNDEEFVEEAPEVVQPKAVNQRAVNGRSASRTTSSANKSRANTTSRASSASSRTASGTSRATTARTATRATTARTARTNTVVNRAGATSTNSRASVRARGTKTTKPVTARVGMGSNSVIGGARSNTNIDATKIKVLEGGEESVYNPNVARVGMQSAGSKKNVRISTSSISGTSTTPIVTETDVSSTTSNLNAIAELTEYCKAQYAACMDNYCNVLDDNQGRCSCSKNLKNYQKVEDALMTATEQFQEAIQKIRYIGLTGPQIESLFAETEAELVLRDSSDSSQLKSSLDAIKRKVVEVSTPSSVSSATTTGVSMDLNGLLNADFTAGFDLNSFLGNATNTNTSSVSNQRGEQLYKTATNRCKTAVLTSCTSQGIDANVVTNSYDLEIDKQCIIYERALTDANTEMKNNVFNATNVLQQARLLLTQNKNSYDLRGCVAAIDECMQDEYVCGSDYELCLDPTGKYLANGEIIKGGTPGISGGQVKNTTDLTEGNLGTWLSGGMYDLYSTWDYAETGTSMDRNAWGMGAKENLGGYIDYSLGEWSANSDKIETDNLAMYLLQKVGYIDTDDNDKVHGMCAAAMKQCQDYTFETKKGKTEKTYIKGNEVVRQYLNSTLAKIKVRQDEILAEYAENCRGDVMSCLASNGYDDSSALSVASKTAINACATEISTCMSVTGFRPTSGTKLTLRTMTDWITSLSTFACPENHYLTINADTGRSDCVACPQTQVATYNVAGGGFNVTDSTIQLVASLGATSKEACTCPDGYVNAYRTDHTHDLAMPADSPEVKVNVDNLVCYRLPS